MRANKGVSIVDVAKEANVSPATVSRVVNGINKVKPEVKERILEAIDALGYTPNHAARSLVKKETGCIGIIVNNLHDPFFHDLIKGFESGAQNANYAVMFCSVQGGDVKSKEMYIRLLTNGFVDAVILYGSYLNDTRVIEYLKETKHIEYLMIENDMEELACNKLLIDNYGGAGKAVEYLIYKGHKRIAHICGNPNKKVTQERLNGYIDTMNKNKLAVHSQYIQCTSTDYKSGYDCMKVLLGLAEPPTAVFCSDDAIASYAVRAAMEQGVRIPEDVSIMGFDNQTILPDSYKGPDISSVGQPLYQIGMDSIKMICERLNSKEPQALIRKTYETEIFEKETVMFMKG